MSWYSVLRHNTFFSSVYPRTASAFPECQPSEKSVLDELSDWLNTLQVLEKWPKVDLKQIMYLVFLSHLAVPALLRFALTQCLPSHVPTIRANMCWIVPCIHQQTRARNVRTSVLYKYKVFSLAIIIGDGVLDLSTKKTSIKSEESSISDPSSENAVAG